MNWGLTASPPASCPVRIPSKSHHPSSCSVPFWSFSSNFAAPFGSHDHPLSSRSGLEKFSRFSFRCNSSTNPGGPSGQAENETKSVLDAFFLGKALAEALNERIESTVGEFLSMIGRLQAEQQKQVQDFQMLRIKLKSYEMEDVSIKLSMLNALPLREEVLERAKKAKEKAAREAMETQGLIPKSSGHNASTVSHGVASGTTSSAPNSTTPEKSSNTSVQPTTESPNTRNEDPLLGVLNED